MYTDPSDFNIDGAKTYPDSWWMPNTGVQRGTVGTDGDYLTPFYPANGILKMINVMNLHFSREYLYFCLLKKILTWC